MLNNEMTIEQFKNWIEKIYKNKITGKKVNKWQ